MEENVFKVTGDSLWKMIGKGGDMSLDVTRSIIQDYKKIKSKAKHFGKLSISLTINKLAFYIIL